jgi:hypothetical protein
MMPDKGKPSMTSVIELKRSLDQMPIDDDLPPIWIIGSGMTVPTTIDGSKINGVPGTRQLCEILIDRVNTPSEKDDFKQRLLNLHDASSHPSAGMQTTGAGASPKAVESRLVELYHDVCTSLRASDRLESSIRKAVLRATNPPPPERVMLVPDQLEHSVGVPGNVPGFSIQGKNYTWSVRPGIRKLVEFIEAHPSQSRHAIVTTNFDPLISVAFNEAGVPHVRFSIDSDYPISYVAAYVPVVYHIHGYWARGQLLNLKGELAADEREKLSASLTDLFRDRRVYVLGYSGWDDVVMTALRAALAGSTRVDWLCHSDGKAFKQESEAIFEKLDVVGGKLRFVEGVNGDEYLRKAVATLPPNDRSIRVKNEILDLERRRIELENRIKELERSLDKLQTLEDKVDAALARIPTATDYLNQAQASMTAFSNTTEDFRDKFEQHQKVQAERFNNLENLLSDTRKHSEFASTWLNRATWSRLNGLRPPTPDRMPEYPESAPVSDPVGIANTATVSPGQSPPTSVDGSDCCPT